MKYKLMIKKHNKTNLKYLCVTSKQKYDEYHGSGVYWKKHLSKHGIDLSTELLCESDDIEIFSTICKIISDDLNVVESDEFANLIPELGYNEQNFFHWWRNATEEEKIEVIDKRKYLQLQNHWINKENSYEIRQKISTKQKEFFGNMSQEEKNRYMKNFFEGKEIFFNDKESESYKSWKQALIGSHVDYYSNVDKSILSERNRKARLSLNDEQKIIRKQKIRDVYSTGKHDKLFERYSNERKSVNNPAAKLIEWNYNVYNTSEFYNYLKINDISKKEALRRLDDNKEGFRRLYEIKDKIYEILTCPYCNKQSSGKNTCGFKKWHFENCRSKNEKVEIG